MIYTSNHPQNALSILAWLSRNEVEPLAHGEGHRLVQIRRFISNNPDVEFGHECVILVNEIGAYVLEHTHYLFNFFDPVTKRALIDVGYIGTLFGMPVLTDRVLASRHWWKRLPKWLKWQYDRLFNNRDLDRRYIVLRQFVKPSHGWAVYRRPPEVAVLNPRY